MFKSHYPLSSLRIAALTGNTFTELTRLKTFHVILLFGLLLIGNSLFMAQWSFQQEFQVLKDVGLGAMSIFTSLIAVLTTSRLLPQDLEDRTVYTILSKPVSRLEYMVGKLGGVLLLLALSVILMSALFFIVLKFREVTVLQETTKQMSSSPPDQVTAALEKVRRSTVNQNLFAGIAVIYLKSVLLACLTLFVSTFASTNIFTTAVMAVVYIIGHLESIARDYWLAGHNSGWCTNILLAAVTLFFPDLQSFNLADDIVAGTSIPTGLVVKIVGLGVCYSSFYFILASAVFYRKEL